ncbi:ATP-binding protein [Methylobacter sp.]|uniref:ATP-binding protein n=1 Tax=Methylobacter sp. TaxID=2051955 RepID=UPI00120C769C|nr:ATP-binding protein [Methylobacter sp.]TAK63117.1 MAG: ATP-binding protein [Methylobacter sp.]
MKSLQLHLGIGLFISLIIVFITLWWLGSSSIRYLAEEAVAEHMENDGANILSAISINDGNNVTMDINRMEPVYLEPFSGDYYQVVASEQVIHSPSLVDQNLDIQTLPAGEISKLYVTGPKQQPLLVMVYGYSKMNRNITIAIAQDLTPTLARIAIFQYRYTLISLVLLLLLIAAQVIILRMGFYPLARIQMQIKALEQGEIAQLDTNVPQEVAVLVREFNGLLTVMEQRLQRSRNSLSDLAHALKTPLTILQQLSREEVLQSNPEAWDTLQAQTQNMQKTMERVLKRGRLAGGGSAALKFDIQGEISALIYALQNIYRDKNLSITFSAPETVGLFIDREDMLELVGNLLDNACKWAKSTVAVSLTTNQKIHLVIEDDGPGVSEDDLARLAQRGTRLDETVNGHGLGLSIARVIVEQHGGQLNMGRSNKLGGFFVEILFGKSKIE